MTGSYRGRPQQSATRHLRRRGGKALDAASPDGISQESISAQLVECRIQQLQAVRAVERHSGPRGAAVDSLLPWEIHLRIAEICLNEPSRFSSLPPTMRQLR